MQTDSFYLPTESNGAYAAADYASDGYVQVATVATYPQNMSSVSTVAFDNREQLIWSANVNGRLASHYYSPPSSLDIYTAVQCHPKKTAVGDPDPTIRQIHPINSSVLVLSQKQLRMQLRTGLTVSKWTPSDFSNLTCMHELVTSSSHISGEPFQMVLGGLQKNLLLFDLNADNRPITINIGRALRVERARNQAQPNCFLMVYDLRSRRAQQPIALPFVPAFVRFAANYSDRRLIVASAQGEYCTFEIGMIVSMTQHVDTGGFAINAMDVCSTNKCVAMGDEAGCLHLLSNTSEPQFNEVVYETVFPDVAPPPENLMFSINDDLAAFGRVPAPYPVVVDEKTGDYLSDWADKYTKIVYRKPLPISPTILASMKMVDFVGYAPAPKGQRLKNVCPYDITGEKTKHSDKGGDHAKDSVVPKPYRRIQPARITKMLETASTYRLLNNTPHSALACYTPQPNDYVNAVLLMLYATPSVRECIWSHVCRRCQCIACETAFVFIAMHDARGNQPVYMNNFLRVFRTLPEASALDLILLSDSTQCTPYQLSNTLHTFTRFIINQIKKDSTVAEQPALRVTRTDSEETKKFEPDSENEYSKRLTSIFGMNTKTTVKCTHCSNIVNTTDSSQHLLTQFNYPTENIVKDDMASFSTLLSNSLHTSTIHSNTKLCASCSVKSTRTHIKTVNALPNVIIVDTNIKGKAERVFWETAYDLYDSSLNPVRKTSSTTTKASPFAQPCRFGDRCNRAECKYIHESREDSIPEHAAYKHYIPESFTAKINDENEAEWSSHPIAEATARRYVLRSCIYTVVNDAPPSPTNQHQAHMITYTKARAFKRIQGCAEDAPPDYEMTDDRDCWLVHNDVSVSRVGPDEALRYDPQWKLPALLLYEQVDWPQRSAEDLPARFKLDESVLASDECLSAGRRLSSSPFVPLRKDELPTKGQLVGLDAEFVATDDNEDNSQATLEGRIIARVTYVRGEGDLRGTSFIDDYVANKEEVTDYLTRHSGIKPADLDPTLSTKHLTTFKASYLKLRYLIDIGVTFVGHGLVTDFKLFNLVVSPSQIHDTVLLFRKPPKRYISLRFLAWCLLDKTIQEHTHDSAEDARTALELYEYYLTIDREELQKVIEGIYSRGSAVGWTVPSKGDTTITA